ncbi:hypothetical protein H6G04_33260 [Calothrix membranacea FACHB-236]|nr:hypothetical protein [Calothrix membranacea FACHB-236]
MSANRYISEATQNQVALCKKTGLNRENLYRPLSPEGNPELRTMSIYNAHADKQISFTDK